MLHHKADPLLLRYNILKYKLSLSISLMLLVSKTLVSVKSTLRSQITTLEASLPWSQVTFPTLHLRSEVLTYLLKRLHLHFLRSMHLQDVTRWILLGGQKESTWNTWINFLKVTAVFTACPVTSRSNRSGLCQLLSAYTFFYMREKVVLYCQLSQKYSSFLTQPALLKHVKGTANHAAAYGVRHWYQAYRFLVCKIGAGYL